jgi:hypothetical protein
MNNNELRPGESRAHAQHELTVTREAADAAARAGFLRQGGTSTVPAKAGTPPLAPSAEFKFDASELQQGELYAGIVQAGGIARHLILLPAEACGVTWQQARTFAAAVGGELPNLGDFDALLQNLREQFSGADAYWSSEWLDRQHAFYLDFGAYPGTDHDTVDASMRARAVRRLYAGHEQ